MSPAAPVSVPTPSRLPFRRLARGAIYRADVCSQRLEGCPVKALEAALSREQTLLREKDALMAEQALLRTESDHRLLNGLQMVGSLLSLQSRTADTHEVALQLSIAAQRVATIERIHRRLHINDGKNSVALKSYLQSFCADFSSMFSSDTCRSIVVQGCEIKVPTVTAIPLGFIANELITNAIKYGKGEIVVALDTCADGGWALSVTNGGPRLPPDFDPAASKGLGMKIIRALVQKIRGELSFGENAHDQGSRFVVRFK